MSLIAVKAQKYEQAGSFGGTLLSYFSFCALLPKVCKTDYLP